MNIPSNQLLRAEYYDNLKVGDTVYPAYDAKCNRITKVTISDISPDKNTITVKGEFWGGNKEIEVNFTRKIDPDFYYEVFYYAYVQYDEDEDENNLTLMQHLGIEPEEEDELKNYPNGGDYYHLYTKRHFDEWIKENILDKNYLETQLD